MIWYTIQEVSPLINGKIAILIQEMMKSKIFSELEFDGHGDLTIVIVCMRIFIFSLCFYTIYLLAPNFSIL